MLVSTETTSVLNTVSVFSLLGTEPISPDNATSHTFNIRTIYRSRLAKPVLHQ